VALARVKSMTLLTKSKTVTVMLMVMLMVMLRRYCSCLSAYQRPQPARAPHAVAALRAPQAVAALRVLIRIRKRKRKNIS
jgi:hypothetical protein